jgi:excisionase family DNA binding protein
METGFYEDRWCSRVQLMTEDTRTAPDPDELLTVAEAARYLKVHRNTLSRWRKESTGPPATRLGRQWRYRRSVLDRWLNEQTGGDDE